LAAMLRFAAQLFVTDHRQYCAQPLVVGNRSLVEVDAVRCAVEVQRGMKTAVTTSSIVAASLFSSICPVCPLKLTRFGADRRELCRCHGRTPFLYTGGSITNIGRTNDLSWTTTSSTGRTRLSITGSSCLSTTSNSRVRRGSEATAASDKGAAISGYRGQSGDSANQTTGHRGTPLRPARIVWQN
jgi:hypothetical protein